MFMAAMKRAPKRVLLRYPLYHLLSLLCSILAAISGNAGNSEHRWNERENECLPSTNLPEKHKPYADKS